MPGSLDDLKNVKFWKAVVAEYIGTWFLVLVGCGTCLGDNWENVASPKFLDIAFAFGLIVATMVWSIGHISGGHINPAVTCGMLVARKITIAKAILYIISQCLGAITGAGILEALSPTDETRNGTLGMTTVSSDISAFQGFGVESLITFVLVFTVFASCDKKRTDLGGSAPLTIGLSVAVCHLFAIKFTGSSMNPARSFGPAVINNYWTNQWVYWIGPIFGGVIAALVYEFCFAVDASIDKIKSYFTVEYNYESNDYDVTTNGGNQQPTKTSPHEAEIAM